MTIVAQFLDKASEIFILLIVYSCICDKIILNFLYKSNCPHAIYALLLMSWLLKVRGIASALF